MRTREGGVEISISSAIYINHHAHFVQLEGTETFDSHLEATSAHCALRERHEFPETPSCGARRALFCSGSSPLSRQRAITLITLTHHRRCQVSHRPRRKLKKKESGRRVFLSDGVFHRLSTIGFGRRRRRRRRGRRGAAAVNSRPTKHTNRQTSFREATEPPRRIADHSLPNANYLCQLSPLAIKTCRRHSEDRKVGISLSPQGTKSYTRISSKRHCDYFRRRLAWIC